MGFDRFVGKCPNCGNFSYLNKCICGWQKVKEFITLQDCLKGQIVVQEIAEAMKGLIKKVNALLEELGVQAASVTSGYRSPEHNLAVGGRKLSNHMTGHALDLADPVKQLKTLLLANTDKLKKYGLHIEDPFYTSGWVHLQDVPPKSKKLVFIP